MYSKGEKIASSVLNIILQLKNPNTQIIYIIKIAYEIIKQNIDIIKKIRWKIIKISIGNFIKKVEKKYIIITSKNFRNIHFKYIQRNYEKLDIN